MQHWQDTLRQPPIVPVLQQQSLGSEWTVVQSEMEIEPDTDFSDPAVSDPDARRDLVQLPVSCAAPAAAAGHQM